jgi:hypothetical protein
LLLQNTLPSKSRTITLGLLVMIISIVISDSLIVFSAQGSITRLFFSDWTVNLSAAAALALSGLTTWNMYRVNKIIDDKNKNKKKQNKNQDDDHNASNYDDDTATHLYPYTSLTIALALWLIAEITWTYYELSLNVENPFPSVADAFWLSGYIFIFYFVFGVYSSISQKYRSDRDVLILVSVASAISLAFVFNLTFGIADIISNRQDTILWVVSMAYPILDGIALVPCLMILLALRDNKKSSFHWILLSTSIVVVTLADIGFGYTEVLDIAKSVNWIWNCVYNAAYIMMAVALFWHYKIISKYKRQVILK